MLPQMGNLPLAEVLRVLVFGYVLAAVLLQP